MSIIALVVMVSIWVQADIPTTMPITVCCGTRLVARPTHGTKTQVYATFEVRTGIVTIRRQSEADEVGQRGVGGKWKGTHKKR